MSEQTIELIVICVNLFFLILGGIQLFKSEKLYEEDKIDRAIYHLIWAVIFISIAGI